MGSEQERAAFDEAVVCGKLQRARELKPQQGQGPVQVGDWPLLEPSTASGGEVCCS